MRELRRIASQGIPDTAGIRSTVWKVHSHSLSHSLSLSQFGEVTMYLIVF